ncbi:DUF445 family protein [Aquibacillus kalidii]|uniref:DUF445 family protein n=1 Tax=Aquibacillus kalidii TaxID=2762597 RepID=UPI001C991714|nr:DUF445 family protein [Aquibacillus kalidii]
MIIIGAIIGGVTNSLAIKMLFRPYEPKFIGNWKIPFTPGLIPKRREELAKQLGKMVVEHLITAEGISKKIKQESFRQQVSEWAQNELEKQLNKEIRLEDFLNQVGINITEKHLRDKLTKLSSNYVQKYMVENKDQLIRDVLDEQLIAKATSGINQIGDYIQVQLTAALASDAARQRLNNLVNSYLDGKGFFGSMISSFIGEEGLADKVQPVLVDYSRSKEASHWINQMVQTEWNRLLDRPISVVDDKLNREVIGDTIGKIIATNVPVDDILNGPVSELVNPIKPQLVDQILPNTVEKLLTVLADRIEPILNNIGLEEIVEKEVSGFPLQRVEQLVLNISRKEFKLITYLGALLGGIIGLIQGILVVLIG